MWQLPSIRSMPGSPSNSLEATPYGQTPGFLIRDNDVTFGSLCARVASTSGIKVLKTPFRAPRANACCERFLGSVRRECLDHRLILHEQQLRRVLQAYGAYFNHARPHQGLQQKVPDQPASSRPAEARDGPILAVPILGGLHYDYRRVA
ncbi:MAG: integrase core domain-containing protein [Ktedonobacterales bacterium]